METLHITSQQEWDWSAEERVSGMMANWHCHWSREGRQHLWSSLVLRVTTKWSTTADWYKVPTILQACCQISKPKRPPKKVLCLLPPRWLKDWRHWKCVYGGQWCYQCFNWHVWDMPPHIRVDQNFPKNQEHGHQHWRCSLLQCSDIRFILEQPNWLFTGGFQRIQPPRNQTQTQSDIVDVNDLLLHSEQKRCECFGTLCGEAGLWL